MRSFHLPGVVAFLVAASILPLPSCSNTGHVNGSGESIDKNAPLVFDSIQKAKNDTLAMQVNESINLQHLSAQRISYSLYNPTDSIAYMFTSEHHGRISMNMHPDSNILWPYFWIYDGKPIMMRLREFHKETADKYAREMVVYLSNDKIVYCNERKKAILDGEIPGAVQNQPFSRSTRTYSEIEADFNKYWTLAVTELKKKNVLPEWIKS